MSDAASALELRGIAQRFGSTVALDGATLDVRAGSLHVLLGENGAGKTTLLHVATGLLRPDAGEILLRGQEVRWRSRAEALAAGLSAVHQHFALVPAMTVAENVALAERVLGRAYSERAVAERIRRAGNAVGLDVDPMAIVGNLTVAAQQRVEIVRAIMNDPAVLMLDEPTAVLSPADAAELFRWLRSFVERGHTVLVVTHRIREAMQHGDAVTVLRGGRTTLASPMDAVDDLVVLSAILGTPSASPAPLRTAGPRGAAATGDSEPVLVLRDAMVTDSARRARLSPTSVSVHSGELVGIAGVDGAGQHELLRLLAGRLQPSGGTVGAPADVGFVPEDRLRDAIVPDFSLVENMALQGAAARRGRLDWTALTVATRTAMEAFSVRAGGSGAPASSLSGGNQQRFVLAREFANGPRALIAENPTRGLDVRAARDVLHRLSAARDAGVAVVVYSSDIDELLSISDRVLVCYAGSVRELPLDADAIGRAMVGAS